MLNYTPTNYKKVLEAGGLWKAHAPVGQQQPVGLKSRLYGHEALTLRRTVRTLRPLSAHMAHSRLDQICL